MSNTDVNTALGSGLFGHAFRSGSAASLASLVAVYALGRQATGHWTPAPNAVSHWVWGDDALDKKGFTLRYTVLGCVIHQLSGVFWAFFFERLCDYSPRHKWRSAFATAALACVVDYKLTPKRLTPGFEHHLSKADLAVIYGCFAAGLAFGRR